MSDPTIDALSRLYAAEHACPTGRLNQTMPYVPASEAIERATIARIVQEDLEHQAWLADLLIDRGTAPPPASYQSIAAEMHYCQLASLLPFLIAAERELIGTYQAESPKLSNDKAASRRVIEIARRHESHLHTFERLAGVARS